MSYPFSLRHRASKSCASSIETTSSTTSSTIVVTVVSLDKSFAETTPCESSDEEHAYKKINKSTKRVFENFFIVLIVVSYRNKKNN